MTTPPRLLRGLAYGIPPSLALWAALIAIVVRIV